MHIVYCQKMVLYLSHSYPQNQWYQSPFWSTHGCETLIRWVGWTITTQGYVLKIFNHHTFCCSQHVPSKTLFFNSLLFQWHKTVKHGKLLRCTPLLWNSKLKATSIPQRNICSVSHQKLWLRIGYNIRPVEISQPRRLKMPTWQMKPM